MATLVETLFGELSAAVEPIVDAATADGGSGDGIRELSRTVGYDIDTALTPALAGQLSTDLGGLWSAITAIIEDPNGFASQLPALISALGDLIAKLDDLNALAGAGADLGRRLLDYCVIARAEQQSPTLAAILALFGLFHYEKVPAAGTLDAYERREVRWDRIPKVLKPGDLFNEVYGWGSATPDTNRLLDRIAEVLFAFGMPASYVGPDTAGMDGELQLIWNFDIGAVSAQLKLLGDADTSGTEPPGIILVPEGVPVLQEQFTIGAGWQLSITLKAEVTSPYQLSLRPPGRLRLQQTSTTPTWTFGGEIGLSRTATDADRAVIFGDPKATRFAAKSIGITARGQTGSAKGSAGLEGAIVGGQVVVAAGSADGFLQQILPADGLRTDFDLILGWATDRGLYIGGSAALEATFAVHATLGPIHIDSVTVTLMLTKTGKLAAIGGVTGGLALGPVAASVDRVGLRLEVDPGPPVDLAVAFEPPRGLGLVVDASVVKGGGYLFFDPDKAEYAGVLELSIKDEIQVKAIGLLTTRLPGGASGFSLVIIITAQFPPIQLGLGFTLTGLGGVAGINRTMVLDVLRTGLKSHTLGSILFPENPVENATKIISDLRSVFPPTEGRYVFGPMLELNWGTPPLITAEIGVFLELPAPIHLAILGIIKATLPNPDAPVVSIHMDSIGTVEFEKKKLAIDASLYDSQIVGLALTGDMALRMLWGDRPNFAMSLGGLNPRAVPPPEFPQLRRLQLSMGDGSNPRLSLDTYFALTSNSVQVGAHLDIRAEGGGFTLHGFLGFDALFIFSPFSFVAGMSGGVDLLRGSSVLMSIGLDFSLSGPAPWHAWGSAHIKILFFSVSVSFDRSWGDPTPAPLPPADARQPLLDALKQSGNWSVALPPETERGASLADASAPSGVVLVHPLGRLEVRQKVVPLGQAITRFGSARPDTYDRFEIKTVTLNGNAASVTPRNELFARAQFFEMTDEEKLSKESFEPLSAGAAIGDDAVSIGDQRSLEIHYETFLVDDPILPSRPAGIYKLRAGAFMAQLRYGAGWQSPVRTTGDLKFGVPGVRGSVGVGDVTHVIVSTDDLVIRDDLVGRDGMSQIAAERALAEHVAKHPEDRGRFQVVPGHEVGA